MFHFSKVLERKSYLRDKHKKSMIQIERTIEEKLEMDKKAPEEKENMSFSSLCKSMGPAVVIGTLAAIGGQELASRCTHNTECITLAGMAAQYFGGWVPFIALHYQNNQHRLKKADGSTNYRTFAQDIGAVLTSDQIGNKIWAGSYVLANEISLRSGVDPAVAGFISGTSSGTIYTLFTAYTAPRVNNMINSIKDKVKSWRRH